MSDQPDLNGLSFDELIERSSLGTPEAKAMRSQTPPEVAHAIVRASEYLARAERAEAEVARLQAEQGTADDPLHPLMPIGDDQPFRDWLDFVERVARPIVEADGDMAVDEQMTLYRLANPHFICGCLVVAANERARLRTVVEAANKYMGSMLGPQRVGDSAKWEALEMALADVYGEET